MLPWVSSKVLSPREFNFHSYKSSTFSTHSWRNPQKPITGSNQTFRFIISKFIQWLPSNVGTLKTWIFLLTQWSHLHQKQKNSSAQLKSINTLGKCAIVYTETNKRRKKKKRPKEKLSIMWQNELPHDWNWVIGYVHGCIGCTLL